MLRKVYLIMCILFYIENIIAYDYTELNKKQNHRHIDRRHRKEAKGRNDRNRNVGERSYSKRHESELMYGDDKPLIKIDVAKFMQPDYDAINYNVPYEYEKETKRRNPVDYKHSIDTKRDNTFTSLDRNREFGNLDASDNAAELKLNRQPLYKDSIYSKQINLRAMSLGDLNNGNIDKDSEITQKNYKSYNNKSQKKCSCKQMKFPFFSRNSKASGKEKSRFEKLFYINYINDSDAEKLIKPPSSSLTVNDRIHNDKKTPYDQNYDRYKRSYSEQLCPECKRKFIDVNMKSNRKRDVKSNIVHNSRQYYERASDMMKRRIQETKRNNDDGVKRQTSDNSIREDAQRRDLKHGGTIQFRKRRRRVRDENNLRQLKELDEVQKKVDGVDNVYYHKGRKDMADVDKLM